MREYLIPQPEYTHTAMTAKELIQELSKVPEDTVIVGGVWNGRVNTYTVLDELHVFLFDEIYADFYGTPGAFDDKQKLLGYKLWQNFTNVINKAKTACENVGQPVTDHFIDVNKKVELGSGAHRDVDDVMLTRYACYLVAQNRRQTE